MSYKFRKEQRLKTLRRFQLVVKKGKIFRGKFLKIRILAEDESRRPVLGVKVTKKVDLRAVKRNVWKRRIKESFRLLQNEILPGRLILAEAVPQEKIPLFAEIKTEFEKLLREAQSLR